MIPHGGPDDPPGDSDGDIKAPGKQCFASSAATALNCCSTKRRMTEWELATHDSPLSKRPFV